MCRASSSVVFATPKVADDTIFANRYKTKYCRHYSEDPATGEHSCKCPYKKKCMFAHSPDELRTTEMNLADGINTKEDIRAYKKRCKAQARAVLDEETPEKTVDTFVPSPSRSQASTLTRTHSHGSDMNGYSSSGTNTPRTHVVPIETASHIRPYTIKEKALGFYSHNPYGAEVLSWEYNMDCPCSQCNYWHNSSVYA